MNMKGWAIWSYGSLARGDSDNLSDDDVLLVGPLQGQPTEILRRAGLDSRKLSISRYSWHEVIGMAEYGSLFLHHVRLEGCPVHETSSCSGVLRRILCGLGDYEHTKRDIKGFRSVLADVRASVNRGCCVVFELSVLATVIRHMSILGCWLVGKARFGRVAPVMVFAKTVGIDDQAVCRFSSLYMYRLYYDGRIQRKELPALLFGEWIRLAETLVDQLEKVADERS